MKNDKIRMKTSYPCANCEKEFKTKSDLKQHDAVHYKEYLNYQFRKTYFEIKHF